MSDRLRFWAHYQIEREERETENRGEKQREDRGERERETDEKMYT